MDKLTLLSVRVSVIVLVMVVFLLFPFICFVVISANNEPLRVEGVLVSVQYCGDYEVVTIGISEYTVVLRMSEGEVQGLIGKPVLLVADRIVGGRASLSLIVGGVE